MSIDKLSVSLEPHLRDALAVLMQILPDEASQQLAPRLSPKVDETVAPIIPYELILKIAQWCQTPNGKTALQACSPPLDPQSYTMVSLLAGTRTSPDKCFPPYTAKDPEEEQRLKTKDRKAIASLVNAVLGVLCTGVAAWWAGGRTGMQLERRALLAVCGALVVAFAEIVLFIIWDSRQAPRPRQPARKYILVRHKDTVESDSVSDVTPQASSTAIEDTSLRHRTTTSVANSAAA